jgi:hypothetical protein
MRSTPWAVTSTAVAGARRHVVDDVIDVEDALDAVRE